MYFYEQISLIRFVVWANADVGHAAQCLQAFVARFPPGVHSKPPHTVPPAGWPMFSAAEVGQRYRQRFNEIDALARPLQSRVSLMKAGSTV